MSSLLFKCLLFFKSIYFKFNLSTADRRKKFMVPNQLCDNTVLFTLLYKKKNKKKTKNTLGEKCTMSQRSY